MLPKRYKSHATSVPQAASPIMKSQKSLLLRSLTNPAERRFSIKITPYLRSFFLKIIAPSAVNTTVIPAEAQYE